MFHSTRAVQNFMGIVVISAVAPVMAQEIPREFRMPGDPVPFPVEEVVIPANDMVFIDGFQVRGRIRVTVDQDAVFAHVPGQPSPLLMMSRKGTRANPPRAYTTEDAQSTFGRSPFLNALRHARHLMKTPEAVDERYREDIKKVLAEEIDTSWPALAQLMDARMESLTQELESTWLRLAAAEGEVKAREAVLGILARSPIVDQHQEPYFTGRHTVAYRYDWEDPQIPNQIHILPHPGTKLSGPETPEQFRIRAEAEIGKWIDQLANPESGFFRFDARDIFLVSGGDTARAAQEMVMTCVRTGGLGYRRVTGVTKVFIEEVLRKNPVADIYVQEK